MSDLPLAAMRRCFLPSVREFATAAAEEGSTMSVASNRVVMILRWVVMIVAVHEME